MIRPRFFWWLALLPHVVVLPVAAEEPPPGPDAVIARFSEQWDDDVWGGRPRKEGGGYMLPLDCDAWKLRMQTLQSLVRGGRRSVAVLTKGLRSDNAATRILAAQAFSLMPEVAPVDMLLKRLDGDGEAAVRLYVADALGAIDSPDVSSRLKARLTQEKNKDVRRHLGYAVARSGKPLDAAVAQALRRWDPTRMATAQVGRAAPDFELTSVEGKPYRLSDFRGKQAVVLVFIYGDT